MSDGSLNISTFVLGAWQTNCFLVQCEQSAWLIDVGFDPEPMLDEAQALVTKGIKLEKIIQTHAHVDHIAGLAQAKQRFPDVPLAIHEAEAAFLGDASLNLSINLAEPIVAPEADEILTHGQSLTLGSMAFEIRHTPGHSPGGISLIGQQAKHAIVGDALFAGSIGRFDFPTSDGELLLRSIKEQLLTLEDDITIHPGHGPTSTIGSERRTNPYLAG